MARTAAMFKDLDAVGRRHANIIGARWGARSGVVVSVTVAAGLLICGFAVLGFSWTRIIGGIDQLGSIVKLMVPPSYASEEQLLNWIRALGETLAIAFLGTLLAATIAFPLSFFAAKNVVAQRVIHFLSRRSFDTIRAVDPLIWALVWTNVVGLGPFAGILAIMTSDIGSFGKLFSEAIEAADRKPVEGVLSTGGSHAEAVRFGLVPQVLPVILSQVLYYFESNTRSATIIGIVGAGGIGLHLSEQIRTLEWQHVSLIVLMILVTVALIDLLSSRLRLAIIGRRG